MTFQITHGPATYVDIASVNTDETTVTRVASEERAWTVLRIGQLYRDGSATIHLSDDQVRQIVAHAEEHGITRPVLELEGVA